MKLFGFLCCLMFLQGSTAYFSLKIMGMVSFQTDITKTLTPLKGSIMKMESSLAGLLKEVTAQAAVPAPLMLRMPVDIFIAYGKMINALLNDLAKYVADSSLTVPRILALLDADVKAIQDFVTKYAPDGKGGDLDTTFTTKFGSAFTAMNGANSALGDALKMLNAALQTIYGTIIPLNGGSVTVDTMITSAITTQVGVFLTNVAVVQDSSDGLTKTLNAANKMQTTLTTAINQIPVAITSAVATYISDGNAAIKSAIMGYSTNSKAMLTAYGTFTAKLQSSYSDTVVGFLIPDAVKMVDDYVASINLQMFAISTGVSTNTKLFTDTTVASGSFTSDTSSIGSALLVTFAAMQDYIQTTFKKNTDIARMCLSGASKTAADIISTAQKMLGQCTSGYAKKFTTSEKTTATISLSIKSTSSNFAKSLTDCMGSSQTKASTVTCINTILSTSFGADLTAQTTVADNGVAGIAADFTAAESDYMNKCLAGITTVASMSLDSLKTLCG